jgi:type IX secretion system PorP/SprF family membrane protein
MQTFTAHAPLKKERIGLGLIANYETYGVTKKTSIFAIYAYHIKFEKAKLSLGIQAGAVMSNTDYTGIALIDPTDPAFTQSIENYTLPNVGFGAYYYSPKFFAGFAIPAFLSYREKSARDGYQVYHDFNNYDFLISTGTLIDIRDNIKLKPSVLVRYYMDNPTFIDLNANVIISDLIWLGASWRTGEDVLVGIFEVQISQQLKIGYAYEYSMSDISDFIGGTHEVVLRLEFSKKVSAANPRYF